MQRKNKQKKILLLALILVPLLVVAARAEDRRVLQCRVLARDFMTELKGELQAALRGGRLVPALSVCSKVAPELAERYSLLPGVEVGRTSERCRNPENRPDSWEKEGLALFQKRRQQGETLAGMEYWQEVDDDEAGEKVFRYLRAIPVGSLCLRCHGENIDGNLAKALSQLYPEDEAVGYRLGELRGALTIRLSP
ncbi:MAG: DUF3365 domain-containing protein [Deltaproteobacteria bacterium]|nr:DUF3365 domain-containing protein [Deltaproteobacteria bacterium]